MTKADIVAKISEKLGLEKGDVQATVESFMEEVKNSLETGDNVYTGVGYTESVELNGKLNENGTLSVSGWFNTLTPSTKPAP